MVGLEGDAESGALPELGRDATDRPADVPDQPGDPQGDHAAGFPGHRAGTEARDRQVEERRPGIPVRGDHRRLGARHRGLFASRSRDGETDGRRRHAQGPAGLQRPGESRLQRKRTRPRTSGARWPRSTRTSSPSARSNSSTRGFLPHGSTPTSWPRPPRSPPTRPSGSPSTSIPGPAGPRTPWALWPTILMRSIPNSKRMAIRPGEASRPTWEFPVPRWSWETYLARHFNHGATLVGINCGATGETLPDMLTKSAFGDEALAAYKKFLSGSPLSEKQASNDNPQARLQKKVRTFEAEAQKWKQEGRDLSPVGRIMQEFEPLMKQGKLPEAEAVLDRAIERLRGKPDAGASAGRATPTTRRSPRCHQAPAERVRVPQTTRRVALVGEPPAPPARNPPSFPTV